MIPDEFRRALVREQYSQPVRQWHPTVDDLIAAGERVERLDTADHEDKRQTA